MGSFGSAAADQAWAFRMLRPRSGGILLALRALQRFAGELAGELQRQVLAAEAETSERDQWLLLRPGAEHERAAAGLLAATAGAQHVAQLAQARWQLDQRTITARRTGRVEDIYFRQGEFVSAGAPIASLLPDDGLKVRFFVPQSQLTAIEHGAPVLVSHDGDETALTATVSYIAREAEFTPPVIYSEGSREPLVFMVEARFAQPVPLHPGLPVTVRLR